MGRTTKTSSKKSNGNVNKTIYKTASELKNVVSDFEISNVRKFKDYWKNDCCYFTLNLGIITIYSMLYLVDKKGKGYITFPKEESKNGEFYSTGFIDSDLAALIVDELEKPGRDPRNDMPKPILRTDVLEMKDLKEGMVLKGTVRNVIDFGAFVDIGVHQDGLVHISQMTDRFIKHPMEVVSVGDVVDVKVLSVDLSKKRIQLSMKLNQ